MAEEQYIMAIDQGTTSSRAIIFDKMGMKIGSSQKNSPNTSLKKAGLSMMPMKFGIQFNQLSQAHSLNQGSSQHRLLVSGLQINVRQPLSGKKTQVDLSIMPSSGNLDKVQGLLIS